MKKQMMLSALTLTAGMATTISFPEISLARSTQVEKAFAHEFLLKLNTAARIKNDKGDYSMGHVYLSLKQNPLTPQYKNKLRGEMTGYLYFESDVADQESNGRKYKTFAPIVGDDGEALLDMVDQQNGTNTYEVYGCNSTKTDCKAERIQVSFTNDQVMMDLQLSYYSQIEFLSTWTETNSDGQKVTRSEWTKEVRYVPMVSVPTQK